MSEFERGHVIEPKKAGWANRRIVCHMGQSNASIRRCWQQWVENCRFQRNDGSCRPWATAYRKDRLIVRSSVNTPDSSLSIFRRAIHTRVSTMTIHRRLLDEI
ncbi:HTH_Tnp_Tc3_2 domain-containing protein [Trichonephila clavipes]|nr:HTH_Tnp_Tc3_2 domain-containing protein [Trichonephila clavipes]